MRFLLLKNSFTFLGTLMLFFGSYYITHAQAVTPASIARLPSCLNSEFIRETCGDIVTASQASFAGGSFRGNDIVAGDLLKCVLGNSFGSKPVCTVTHADKTNSISQESFFGALHSSSTDQHGNVTATADKSATDRAAGAAGGIIGDTVSAAASAAVIAASYAILTFTQYLLALAGTLFNFVMLRTVFQFSTLIGNSPGLLIGWGLLRDIGNMVLLFGFLYIGISTILNLGTYTVKKSLPGLLIFAVLINFSLFAAEAVIDTSNLFSTVMYSQANTNPCPESVASGKPADPKTLQDCGVNYGIAGHILQTTGLSSVWKIPQGLDANFTNASVLLGISLFSMVAVIVLVAASIMLVARAVILTFVMVTAPIGFAAMALPTKSMKDLSSKWQSALLNQSFFAPIFLLLILVSLKIVDSFSRDGNLGEALMKQNTSIMGIIMIFVVVIGFMIGSLVAAKKFGGASADFAIGKASKLTGALTLGAAGFVGRRTLGAGAAAGAKRLGKSNFVRNNPFLGRTALASLNGIASSSFDARATKAFKATTKYASSKTGLPLDMGGPGKVAAKGYNEILNKAKKEREAVIKQLGNNAGEEDAKSKLNKAKASIEATTEIEKKTKQDIAGETKTITQNETIAQKQAVEDARREQEGFAQEHDRVVTASQSNIDLKTLELQRAQGDVITEQQAHTREAATINATIAAKRLELSVAQNNGDIAKVRQINVEIQDQNQLVIKEQELSQARVSAFQDRATKINEELIDLKTKHITTKSESKDVLNTKIQESKTRTQAVVNDSKARITNREEEAKNLIAESDARIEAIKNSVDALLEVDEETGKKFTIDQQIKRIEEAPKRQYADALVKNIGAAPFVARRAGQEVAAGIRKEFKKSNEQRNLEALKAEIKKEAGEEASKKEADKPKEGAV